MHVDDTKLGQADRGNAAHPKTVQKVPVSEAPLKPSTAGMPLRLLTEKDMRDALGGISERKFKQLQADEIVPDPLELGPRSPRWTPENLAETIRRLPRRKRAPEPETLAQGRRGRIERMKSQTAG